MKTKIIDIMKLLFFVSVSFLIISCEKDKNTIPNNDGMINDTISHDSLWLNYNGYIPFPEGDAVWFTKSSESIWNSGQVHENQPPDTVIEFENQFYISSDTVIKNVSYKKIIRNFQYKKYDFDIDYGYPGNLVEEGNKREILGSFRQDKSKKIYIVYSGQEKEELLYNFDLNIGDTSTIYTNEEYLYTVYCIDSIKLKERYHNVFYFKVERHDGVGSAVINKKVTIEGIGSYLYGPFKNEWSN